MGWDELGDCGDGVFFFLGFGDDNIGVRGVSASFTSKLESGVWLFFFVWGPVYRSPTASVLGSFFIKYAKSVSDGCWSFEDKLVLLLIGTPPLQIFEAKVDGD